MMTEKYCTLPPPTSSLPICYSTTYHSPTITLRNRIRDIKYRFHSQQNSLSLHEPNNMKLLIEQQPTIRTFSLYDVQNRIDYFEKKKLSDEIENISKEKSKQK